MVPAAPPRIIVPTDPDAASRQPRAPAPATPTRPRPRALRRRAPTARAETPRARRAPSRCAAEAAQRPRSRPGRRRRRCEMQPGDRGDGRRAPAAGNAGDDLQNVNYAGLLQRPEGAVRHRQAVHHAGPTQALKEQEPRSSRRRWPTRPRDARSATLRDVADPLTARGRASGLTNHRAFAASRLCDLAAGRLYRQFTIRYTSKLCRTARPGTFLREFATSCD